SLLGAQRALGKRHCKKLIWPERTIVPIRAVDYVKTALKIVIPVPHESLFHALGKTGVLVSRPPDLRGKSSYCVEGVEPQRIYLHRLAHPRRNRATVNLCIHPCQLHFGFPRLEQTIGGIHANAISGTAHVPSDHGRNDVENV